MKPTVFFSHSSLDKDSLLPIRNRIIEGTGGSIDIFMSSDGASIPFGKSWLGEIERALHDCKLMFVWVTPNSLRSNWIYFESGCAYSRGIKVVPIGYDGIKLEELAPPLSILQGFNITSPASLNNIITVIDREFNLSFPGLFDDDFYSAHVHATTSESSPELLEYVDGVTCLFYPSIQLHKGATTEIKANWRDIFRAILARKGASFTEDEGDSIFGLGFELRTKKGDGLSWPAVDIDPLALNRVWDILRDAVVELYNNGDDRAVFVVHPSAQYALPGNQSLIASRLVDTEVKFGTTHPNLLFSYRNILFRVNVHIDMTVLRGATNHREKSELAILADASNLDPIPLLSLMKLLVRQRVIRKTAYRD